MMNEQLEQLHNTQMEEFELAAHHFGELKQVKVRNIECNGFTFVLQHNPTRMLSTAAKVDAQSLKERKCFLCPQQMPATQKGIPYGTRYNLFINPYPIFPRHFTVPDRTHCLQLFDGRIDDMLSMAETFTAYTVFYNGPQSGASAPDHFHFQLAQRHIMPIESDTAQERIIAKSPTAHIATIDNYLRKVILLHSTDKQQLCELFGRIVDIIAQVQPNTPEPMMNILAWYDCKTWTVALFPRRQHRPWQFFAEGKEHILFSPGCVDFAGLLIIPRQEDFMLHTPETLADLFGQLTVTDETWVKLENELHQLTP